MPNVSYELELSSGGPAPVTFNPHPTTIDEGQTLTINVTTTAGYHVEYNLIEGCEYQLLPSETNINTIILSNPTEPSVVHVISVQDGPGPGPTPTESDDYCYVDRIKKFITRMEGNKFSEVE